MPGVEGVVLKARTSQRNGEDNVEDPAWIRAIQGRLPSYADEVLAILLIALGLTSFFALLSPAGGDLGNAWSDVLTKTFGVGSFAIATMILLAGGLLLVPKLGIRVRLNWWRIIAGEVAFVLVLAYIHATTSAGLAPELAREEAFASALEGRGGGFVGWAIQDLLFMLVGEPVTSITLIVLALISLGLMLGVTRRQMVRGLGGFHNRLLDLAWRLDGKPRSRKSARSRYSDENPGYASEQIEPPTTEMSGPHEASLPDGSVVIELPPIPGRPSIVTGAIGAGALTVRRSGTNPVRVSSLHRPSESASPEPAREIQYRFSLKDTPDKKKIRKRSADLPPFELMEAAEYSRPTDEEVNVNAQIIEETVDDFGMTVEVVGVKAGPTVTQYAVRPSGKSDQPGQATKPVRVTRVTALAQDLSLALASPRIRIQAPVPGTNYIGIEVPNSRPGIVSLRPVMESERYSRFKSPLAVALGREVDGSPFAADLTTMPHLLIGGTTGSGKSVCLASLTTCLVTNNSPDDMRLVMIDPKMVELIRFNGLPHLYGRVEVELTRIIGVLRWATREMDRRYKLMEAAQARNIIVYNQGRKKKDRLPYIVILVDELAEMMTEYHDETEHLLTRLAQMARATGIHLIVATQRPSTDIVTGLIKANFPARIAFAVASGVDSRVIIDSVGAEDLIGKGDMLYYASDAAAGPVRLQGCFVSDQDMERIVEFWREKWEGKTKEDEPAPWEASLTRAAMLDETDQMLEDAIRLIQKEGEASASMLQRKLNVSYPRAGRLIDALYKIGVVGDPVAGGRVRRVLIGPDVDPTTFIVNWRNTHR